MIKDPTLHLIILFVGMIAASAAHQIADRLGFRIANLFEKDEKIARARLDAAAVLARAKVEADALVASAKLKKL
jgi:lauroyl/myristoyl acyltransferase